MVTELKNRGVADIFIAGVDGLKGFPEAIDAFYTQLQLCNCVTVYRPHGTQQHKLCGLK